MKKTLFGLLFTLSVTIYAGDRYDPITGLLHLSMVTVDVNKYEVDMLHQGGLSFSVLSATKIIENNTSCIDKKC